MHFIFFANAKSWIRVNRRFNSLFPPANQTTNEQPAAPHSIAEVGRRGPPGPNRGGLRRQSVWFSVSVSNIIPLIFWFSIGKAILLLEPSRAQSIRYIICGVWPLKRDWMKSHEMNGAGANGGGDAPRREIQFLGTVGGLLGLTYITKDT